MKVSIFICRLANQVYKCATQQKLKKIVAAGNLNIQRFYRCRPFSAGERLIPLIAPYIHIVSPATDRKNLLFGKGRETFPRRSLWSYPGHT